MVSRKNTPARRASSRGDSVFMTKITPVAPEWFHGMADRAFFFAFFRRSALTFCSVHTFPMLLPQVRSQRSRWDL
jgi:hypothetical protein